MRVEKQAFVIVLLVAAIVMAVPLFRGFAYSQIRQALAQSGSQAGTNRLKPSIPNLHPKSDAQLLNEHPKDFSLRLALAEDHTHALDSSTGSAVATKSAESLVRDYPDKGVVYVVALRLSPSVSIPNRMEGYGITPEDAAKYYQKPRPATREELDAVRRRIPLLDKAIAADPGNGWFHYVKAGYLYGLHRDKEGTAEVHLAAVAPRFTDYTDVQARAAHHLSDLRGGFDPVLRASRVGFIGFAPLAQMRNTARIAAHLAYRDIRRGSIDRGIHEALDLTSVGDAMARGASTYIHALVGHSILAIGAQALNPNLDLRNKKLQAERAAELKAYRQFLTAHGHPAEAAQLTRRWHSRDLAASKIRQTCGAAESDLWYIFHYVSAFAACATALPAVILLLGGWGTASLLTLKGGARACWDRRAGAISACIALLAVPPIIAETINVVNGDALVAALVGGSSPSPTGPAIVVGIAAAVALAALVVGCALMLMRKPNDGENRRIPVAPLLIAYLATATGLTYMASVCHEFAGSDTFLGSFAQAAHSRLILLPFAGIVAYALLRALQCRFGRVRRKAPLAFVATIRYGMATAAGLLAVFYVCLLFITAFLGVRADAAARRTVVQEAAFIRSICR